MLNFNNGWFGSLTIILQGFSSVQNQVNLFRFSFLLTLKLGMEQAFRSNPRIAEHYLKALALVLEVGDFFAVVDKVRYLG